MPFYLRKSFRFGPLRLNLSKSGLGASFGVTGARIGVTSHGRAYVHGGRGGLYFRETLGGGGRRGGSSATGDVASAASGGPRAAGPITLYEDTGVTYAPADAADRDAIARLEVTARRPVVWPYLLAGATGLALAAAALAGVGSLGTTGVAGAGQATRAALLVIGAGLLLATVFPLRRVRRANRARERLRAALSPAVTGRRPFTDAELEVARGALADATLPARARRAELERACLAAARRIVDDGAASPDELQLLEQFAAELGLDGEFCDAAGADAFRGVYLRVVADRELMEDEERALAALRGALGVADDVIAGELDVVRRLAELRRIRAGELPVVEPGVALREGESCHYVATARLLKERNLRRFQRDRQVYRVRGLVVDREGTLLITDRRLLLVHTGTTSVRLDRILDLEVDVDRSLLRIVRDGVKTPMLITTPDAVRAGAVLATAAGV